MSDTKKVTRDTVAKEVQEFRKYHVTVAYCLKSKVSLKLDFDGWYYLYKDSVVYSDTSNLMDAVDMCLEMIGHKQ